MARNETHEYVHRILDGHISVDNHIKAVQAAADGLENATVDCEIQGDYGGDCAVMYVSGYKLLNEEEQAAKRAALDEELAAADERERAELARLKSKYES